MTNQELSKTLATELRQRGWSIYQLARAAGVPYETARRAVHGIGNISLKATNELLVALELELTTEPA